MDGGVPAPAPALLPVPASAPAPAPMSVPAPMPAWDAFPPDVTEDPPGAPPGSVHVILHPRVLTRVTASLASALRCPYVLISPGDCGPKGVYVLQCPTQMLAHVYVAVNDAIREEKRLPAAPRAAPELAPAPAPPTVLAAIATTAAAFPVAGAAFPAAGAAFPAGAAYSASAFIPSAAAAQPVGGGGVVSFPQPAGAFSQAAARASASSFSQPAGVLLLPPAPVDLQMFPPFSPVVDSLMQVRFVGFGSLWLREKDGSTGKRIVPIRALFAEVVAAIEHARRAPAEEHAPRWQLATIGSDRNCQIVFAKDPYPVRVRFLFNARTQDLELFDVAVGAGTPSARPVILNDTILSPNSNPSPLKHRDIVTVNTREIIICCDLAVRPEAARAALQASTHVAESASAPTAAVAGTGPGSGCSPSHFQSPSQSPPVAGAEGGRDRCGAAAPSMARSGEEKGKESRSVDASAILATAASRRKYSRYGTEEERKEGRRQQQRLSYLRHREERLARQRVKRGLNAKPFS